MPKSQPTPSCPPLSPALVRLIDALAEVVAEECMRTAQSAAVAKSERIRCNSHSKPLENDVTRTVLLSFEDVSARVGLGRTRIYAGVAAGDFPKPIKLGRRSLWVQSEITQWIADRVAERDATCRAQRL